MLSGTQGGMNSRAGVPAIEGIRFPQRAAGASRSSPLKTPPSCSSSTPPGPKSKAKAKKWDLNLRPLKANRNQVDVRTSVDLDESLAWWDVRKLKMQWLRILESDGRTGLSELPAWGMWGLYACYMGWVLSTDAPGNPVYQMSPETTQELIHETISLLYINPILANFNLSIFPDVAEHPVAEALFTFAITWDAMMWPAMVADKKGAGMKYKKELWYGSLGSLMVLFMPYMALRLSNSNRKPMTDASADEPDLPSYSPAFGWFGLAVFGASVAWILFARPEFGDLASRLDYAVAEFNSERVFYANSITCMIYSIFQFMIMEEAPMKYRILPYVGLCLWLVEGPQKDSNSDSSS